MIGIGVGIPLTEFITATCTICGGMILGVMFCCLFIKMSSRRVSGADRHPYGATDVSNTQKEVLLKSRDLIPQTILQKPTAQSECCTIYVPDVGFVL